MCCWNVVTYKWKVHKEKIEIISFVVYLTVPSSPLFQLQAVGQGMKRTWLYMWYPLFHAHLD